MSRLVARLMLAVFLLPIAAVLYLLGIAVALEIFSYRQEEMIFFFASAVVLCFVGVYWVALWRSSVSWTRRRLGRTYAVSAAAVGAGFVSAVVFVALGAIPSFGIFIGTTVAGISWLPATVVVWRETVEERSARLRSAGAETVRCLSCGYNLTGLKQTTCPECGVQPTIEELLAGQRSREEKELTSGPA